MKRTIKNRITSSSVLLVVIPVISLGILAIMALYGVTTRLVESDMQEIVTVAVERAQWELQAYSNISVDAGMSDVLGDESASVETIKTYLQSKADYYNLERGNFINLKGEGIDGNNYTDREYFQQALKGKPSISEPVVSKVTGKLTIIVAAPVYKDGIVGNNVIGCVYFVPHEEFLNDIVRAVKCSENSSSYIIDSGGNTIAADDAERVKAGENLEEVAKTTSGMAGIADVHSRMRNGESDFVYLKNSQNKGYMVFAPIADSDGWSLALFAPVSDYMDDIVRDVFIIIAESTFCIIAAVVLAARIGRKIGKPLSTCTNRLELLANGDLTTPVEEVNSGDETQVLAETTTSMVDSLSAVVKDISGVLNNLAAGNLKENVSGGKELYIGDFAEIYVALDKIQSELRRTMGGIYEASNQVAAGATQVSGSSQVLAQGATEQAGAAEELASTVSDVASKVEASSKNCDEAKIMYDSVTAQIDEAINGVHNLETAMNSINQASKKIGAIIQTIDDIAFQTNILALNAAVEAARAGEAGRGFSVVADEVRNLATKSQEAVQETDKLINESTLAVESGVTVTKEVTSSIEAVIEAVRSMGSIVDTIKADSEVQVEMVNQINEGISQIAVVVQNNTATAEETAATSEELDGQSNALKSMVSHYKI